MEKYVQSLQPKLLYVMTIPDDMHRGCVKVGDATIPDGDPTQLAPNCKLLNDAAKKRIDEYTKTAAIPYKLLYTELLVFFRCGLVGSIRDYEVHNVLKRSGIKQPDFGIKNQGSEWYCCDAFTVQNAIKAAKEGRYALNADEIHISELAPIGEVHKPSDEDIIHFREEQLQAIKMTISRFEKGGKKMLWNAKMRFGKTLSTLEVVRQMEFHRTLILTHRPAVNDEWSEEFKKIFVAPTNWRYGSRSIGFTYAELEKDAAKDPNKHYIYFASMQDLRGSELAGGKFDKNLEEFSTDWDLLIVDEAHEGTQTILGQNVIDALVKENTHILSLSGTPFNLLDEYQDGEIFTWDYVMEQRAKRDWDLTHFGDPNPYSELPKLNIYTFDLGHLLGGYEDLSDKAFNFKEFFRVQDEKFIHAQDVRRFLDLIVKVDDESNYPYSTVEFRKDFRHSLWMVPGVNEAKALSEMLNSHPIFGKFQIVNVAGEGDDDMPYDDAKKVVLDAIGKDPEQTYTITLSCGRLTTGVTIKPWTAVFMLSGSYSTDAKAYMQTIFRVQSPWNFHGKQKEQCYVFDFAPDRTLKVIAETAKVSAKVGKTTEKDKKIMGDFLNFCPVIGYNGTKMAPFDVNHLMEQLKRVYVDRVVRRGFDDVNIYSDRLIQVTPEELQKFENLKKIIGTTKAMHKTDSVDMAKSGLTDEQYAEKERIEKKPKRQRTLEEEELLKKLKMNHDQKMKLISILRGVSVRVPLLIYGADLKDEKTEITMATLPDIVDDVSWEEFMPNGVTKEIFSEFVQFYDEDVIRSAARQIRDTARAADMLPPTERVAAIALIFSHFHNPDKETVLTPWRVVNMHMSDCLGGYCFYDDTFDEEKGIINTPRLVEQKYITNNVFANPETKILEINSKTGLYPLYVTYSTYRYARQRFIDNHMLSRDLTLEEELKIWDDVVQKNIFVICKTAMARSITRRTLLGFRQGKANLHAFDDLLNQVQNNKQSFIKNITRPGFWNLKNQTDMLKFNAIVGNPPYQEVRANDLSKTNSAFASAIYPMFFDVAELLKPKYISMITPSRWMTKTGQGILDSWVDKMLSCNHFIVIHDYPNATDCFEGVEIKGGVNYFLFDNEYKGKCKYSLHQEDTINQTEDYLDSLNAGVVIRDVQAKSIIKKIMDKEGQYFKELSFADIVGPVHLFDKDGILGTSWTGYVKEKDSSHQIKLILNKKLEDSGIGWISEESVPRSKELISLHKVFIPEAGGSGNDSIILGKPIYAEPNSVCSETYLCIGYNPKILQLNEEIGYNIISYINTKFFRYLVSIKKRTQHATASVYQFVPLQNFNVVSDIDWSQDIKGIDQQLYKKYHLSSDEIAFIESMIKPM